MAASALDDRSLLALTQNILADIPLGLLLLDGKAQPLWYNEEAAFVCAVWTHGESVGPALRLSEDSFTCPAILRSRGLALLAGWEQSGELPEVTRVNDEVRGLHALIELHLCGPTRSPAFSVRLDYRRPRADRDHPLSPESLALCARLTHREREVALRVRDGLTNGEIAAVLRRSPLTIKTQMAGVLSKLGVRNRARVAVLLNR